MSLINDALKEARRNPPRTPSNSSPLLPPVPQGESTPILTWLIPALVILLIVGGIFFVGWASANHVVLKVDRDPAFISTQKVAEVIVPIVPVPAEPPPPVRQPDAPLLQGVFYSTRNPSAIVNGKTVGIGDRVEGYRVKEITKYTVTLVGDDGKSVKIGMSN